MQVVVVTPEKTALDETADSVVLPLFDGSYGIMKDHAPMIGRLGFGEMRIHISGRQDSYYVDGGFVQVADNVVSVLTGRAIPVKDIDVKTAEKALAEAEKMEAPSAELAELRQRSISQAKAQIKLGRG